MAKKAPSPKTTRKPPEPAESHAVIQEWKQQVMPALQPIVDRLDALIRKTIPGLEYAIKWKQAYYGLPECGWIIQMVAYDVSVNLVFYAGAEFDPPPPLGTGSRYVKLTNVDEVDTLQLRRWIEQAANVPGWKR